MSVPLLTVRVQLLAGAWLDLDNAPAAVGYVATLDEPEARAAFDACCAILRRALGAPAPEPECRHDLVECGRFVRWAPDIRPGAIPGDYVLLCALCHRPTGPRAPMPPAELGIFDRAEPT